MFPYSYSFMSPPCRNGHHVFIYGATYSTFEPPEGTPCACGQVFWHRRNLTPYALDGAYCACPIYVPSYESTVAKCAVCGKPPRQ